MTIRWAIKIRARPRQPEIRARRKSHLEQLQVTGAKSSFGTRQIQAPHPDELLVEHPTDDARRVLEPLPPALQRPRIVRPQILNVDDGQIRRLEDLRHLLERG